jgi:transglutaminase-like putative cysteine protease
MQRYRVLHETTYQYASDVVHAQHLLHLVPRPLPYQQGVSFDLELTPQADQRQDLVDAFGNVVTRLEFGRAHRRLAVVSELQVDVRVRPPSYAELTDAWEQVRGDLCYGGTWPANARLEACRFRHESPYVRVKQMFTDYAEECFPPRRPILACADALMAKLHSELEYAPGETTIETPLHEVLRARSGVCQDFAHLMIACLRSRGLAARYVSGYLRARPGVASRDSASPGSAGGALVGTGATHAWVSVFCPPVGWVDLDPTNNCRIGIDHIVLAWGRDYGDVSPLRGVILGGESHQLLVGVKVEALAQ